MAASCVADVRDIESHEVSYSEHEMNIMMWESYGCEEVANTEMEGLGQRVRAKSYS
jgi:hypothetical protein